MKMFFDVKERSKLNLSGTDDPLQIQCNARLDVVKECSPIQCKNVQLLRQYFREKKMLKPHIFKDSSGYPGLLKLIIILDLIKICITHAR